MTLIPQSRDYILERERYIYMYNLFTKMISYTTYCFLTLKYIFSTEIIHIHSEKNFNEAKKKNHPKPYHPEIITVNTLKFSFWDLFLCVYWGTHTYKFS